MRKSKLLRRSFLVGLSSVVFSATSLASTKIYFPYNSKPINGSGISLMLIEKGQSGTATSPPQIDDVLKELTEGSESGYMDTLYQIYNQFFYNSTPNINNLNPLDTKSYWNEANVLDNTPATIGGLAYALGFKPVTAFMDVFYMSLFQGAYNIVMSGSLTMHYQAPDLTQVYMPVGVSKQKKEIYASLMTQIMAGYSYGYIVNPNQGQVAQYSGPQQAYYAYRLTQQALRNGVIRAQLERIMWEKEDLADLLNLLPMECQNTQDSIFAVNLNNTTPLSAVTALNNFISSAAGSIYDTTYGGYHITYQSVDQTMGQGFSQLYKMISGLGNLSCMQLETQIVGLKVQIQQSEMLLDILQTQYSQLSNEEKSVQ